MDKLPYTRVSEELNNVVTEIMDDYKKLVEKAKSKGLDIKFAPYATDTLELYFHDDYPNMILVDKDSCVIKRRVKMNANITLRDFLRKKTNAMELCVIRDKGWIVATCWIDYEDRFYIPQKLADMMVKNDEWDYLSIVNENNARIKVPCHYIDI